jgi:hypothetical protein
MVVSVCIQGVLTCTSWVRQHGLVNPRCVMQAPCTQPLGMEGWCAFPRHVYNSAS